MKTAYIFSDSHGYIQLMRDVLAQAQREDTVIFLGDMNRDIQRIQREFPLLNYVVVQGNNDYEREYPYTCCFTLEGVRIMACHGHKQRVKLGPELLCHQAVEQGCKLAFYGHTHLPKQMVLWGVHLVNPGSCTSQYGTYCRLMAEKGQYQLAFFKGDGTEIVL